VLLERCLTAAAAVYERNAFFVFDLVQFFEKLAQVFFLDLTVLYLS
jgi:hypothetical protein